MPVASVRSNKLLLAGFGARPQVKESIKESHGSDFALQNQNRGFLSPFFRFSPKWGDQGDPTFAFGAKSKS